jgi:D-alanyl-D-alanine carboxypeptidase/D-alanyl-D-alanine-endopeptidase (penicillin-binding protein 4)
MFFSTDFSSRASMLSCVRVIARPLASILIAFAGTALAASAHAELPEPIAQLLQAAHIPEDAVGIMVLRGGEPVLAHNAGQTMSPASTIKVLTSIVALEQLGPVFRGRTELRTDGVMAGNTLKGDLVLRGGADADLTEDVLRQMLQTLRNQGIKTIHGDLLVDRQLFQPARADLGTPPFDGTPEFRYNVIPDALMLNTNMLDVGIDSTGKPLKLVMTPALDGVTLTSDLQQVKGDCANWEDGWRTPDYIKGKKDKLIITLHGTFPSGCSTSTSINVLDREDYTERLFRTLWRQLDGEFTGDVSEAPGPPGTRLLAEHLARPLPEILRDQNKWSINALARLVFLSLGSLEGDVALGSHPLLQDRSETTAARSARVIRQWLAAHDIPDDGLVLENGSGLSRIERIRPDQLAAILQAASQSLWAPEFITTLPIAGIDGTMRRRLRASPAAMRARLKTGTLNDAIAIAGFVPDAKQRPCIVVAIINYPQVGKGAGRPIIDALVDWVASSK